MRRLFLVLAAGLLVVPAPVCGQTAPAQSETLVTLDWMVGDWSGNGKHFGRDSAVTLTVKTAAGGAAYSLDYSVIVSAAGDNPEMRFAAHGFYQRAKGREWHGRWTDNFGNLHDLSGVIEGQKMTTLWGSPATEIGRSSYALIDGKLRIIDTSLNKDGVFDEFGQSQLVRRSI
jgi:hypothetical protein